MNPNHTGHSGPAATEPPVRPGIGPETLVAAGVHYTALRDVEIPYFDSHGNPTGFSRLRLAHVTPNGQRYHQQPGSGVHVYFPPGFHALAPGGDLCIVEGEFKSLSLMEAGWKAIGLPGFGTYTNDANSTPQLLPGIREAINSTRPDRILFSGDADTATNYEFARYAVFLAHAVNLPVLLPRIPIGGPGKGVDDCRGALGEKFLEFWRGLVANAEPIDSKDRAGNLAARLLEREAAGISVSTGAERDKITHRIVKMAVACEAQAPLAKDRILKFAKKALGITKAAFLEAVAAATEERAQSSKENRESDGQDGHSCPTPSQWFAEKFPLIADEHGAAVLEETDKKSGVVSVKDVSEDFLAATMGDKGTPDAPAVFLSTEGRFYIYTPTEGMFVHQREPALLTRFSRMLLDCHRACRDGCQTQALEFRLRDTSTLGGVIQKARGLLEVPSNYFSSELTEFIPCANGMLRLRDRELLPFSPSYRRRNKLAVPYDPSAKCPLFLETLMRHALDPDALDLLQRWCGLALIGENVAQVIMILTGTAGGGKGTFLRVLTGITGQENLASLRTHLLGERFEIGRFNGKTLLYGADVPEDFLNHRNASVLKSLTGGDPMTLEFKNSNESPPAVGDYNVIVTSNSRLTMRLEGDADAWRRRLRIIPYNNPKPKHVIADLDKRIIETEGSGVLNYMLDGLDKNRADGWQLHQTTNQQAIVDNLLLESDGHAVFARECLVRDDNKSLTQPDCFAAYVEFATRRNWNALTKNRFGALIGDVVVRQFGITQAHDIPDAAGKRQRGWRGVALVGASEKTSQNHFSSQSTGETVSEASENQDFGQTGHLSPTPIQEKHKSAENFPESSNPAIPAETSTPARGLSAADRAAALADFPPASKAVDHTKWRSMKRLVELSEEFL